MNTNEDYISNQIAVYKNSRTLLEFQDKLRVAPIASYAHIHAGGETGPDGRRTHSLIGILMKDYSKGTGDRAVTVCANISPKEAKFILSRLTAGFPEYAFQQEKIFGDKDEKGYAKVSKVRIIRATMDGKGAERKLPWYVEVENGRGIPLQNGKGICQLKRPGPLWPPKQRILLYRLLGARHRPVAHHQGKECRGGTVGSPERRIGRTDQQTTMFRKGMPAAAFPFLRKETT